MNSLLLVLTEQLFTDVTSSQSVNKPVDVSLKPCYDWRLLPAGFTATNIQHLQLLQSVRCASTSNTINTTRLVVSSGLLQVFCSKIPRLFQSWNDNFPGLIETITLSHKCQKWYIISQVIKQYQCSDMQMTEILVGGSDRKTPVKLKHF